MTDHTLTEIAAIFGRLDGIDDENHGQYEKALRNLVQRHYLPPTGQQGRIFVYDRPAAVTIRLAQIASEFGIPRTTIDMLARWLSNSGVRRKKLSNGWVGVSRAAEAIQRVEENEVFSFHLVLSADRIVGVKADWNSDHPLGERAESVLRMIDQDAEIARFTLPASAQIAKILPLLAKA